MRTASAFIRICHKVLKISIFHDPPHLFLNGARTSCIINHKMQIKPFLSKQFVSLSQFPDGLRHKICLVKTFIQNSAHKIIGSGIYHVYFNAWYLFSHILQAFFFEVLFNVRLPPVISLVAAGKCCESKDK